MDGLLDAVYEKEWMENYLRVRLERTEDSEYEEKMLSFNNIRGFLQFETAVTDGSDSYRYKVTGKKPLSAVFQALPIREWHLKKILNCLIETVERGREYLICDNDLVLEPEDVFVNLSDYSVEIMCLPGFGKDFRESMEKLLEFMLNRVDYDDKKAVELIYDCYVLALKEENGLNALKDRILKGEESETDTWAEQKKSTILPEPAHTEPEKKQRPAFAKEVFWDDDAEEDLEEETSGFLKWIKGLFTRHSTERVPAVAEERTVFSERPDIIDDEPETRTVFLSQRKVGSTPYLLSIATGEMIRLEHSPFSVGSMQEHLDRTLNGEGVSRLHARLYTKDGNWFVSDLNSTNGTYVNERTVMPGKDMILYNNDKIRFAGEEYIYKSANA